MILAVTAESYPIRWFLTEEISASSMILLVIFF